MSNVQALQILFHRSPTIWSPVPTEVHWIKSVSILTLCLYLHPTYKQSVNLGRGGLTRPVLVTYSTVPHAPGFCGLGGSRCIYEWVSFAVKLIHFELRKPYKPHTPLRLGASCSYRRCGKCKNNATPTPRRFTAVSKSWKRFIGQSNGASDDNIN